MTSLKVNLSVRSGKFKTLKQIDLKHSSLLECSKFVRKNPGKFVTESDVPEQATYDTRNGQKNENKLHVKPVTLNLCSQNQLIMAPRIFNKLPAALKVIEEDQIFCKKKFYTNICFTTFTSS
jgi:hypothetical protein